MFTFKSDRFPPERVEADAMLERDIDEACVVFLCRPAASDAASGTVVYVYRESDLDLPERALTKKKDGAWSFEDLPSDGTPDQPDPPDSLTCEPSPPRLSDAWSGRSTKRTPLGSRATSPPSLLPPPLCR